MPADARDNAPVVAVFGSYDPAGTGEGDGQAYDVGRRLAELGCAVANGGYGGTMAASARGAVEAGGHTIGVTCSVWGARANAYIREVVRTAGLAERIERLESLATAGFVVLPGGTGTLLELAWVWEGMAKGMLARRPVVCMGEFWAPVVAAVAAAGRGHEEFIHVAASPADLDRFFPPPGA